MISLYVDEIGEALAEELRATVGTSLGLVVCEQGDYSRLPAAEDLDDDLPMLLIEFLRTDPPEIKMGRARITYHYRVKYMRRQVDRENPIRPVNRAISRIFEALANNGATRQVFKLDRLDGIAGLEVEKVVPQDVLLDNQDNAMLNIPEFRCNCAWIDVLVQTESEQH